MKNKIDWVMVFVFLGSSALSILALYGVYCTIFYEGD